MMSHYQLCESYRAVFEETGPNLHSEAPSSILWNIRVNDGDVDQCRKVCTHCGQMATVCKPCTKHIRIKTNQHQLKKKTLMHLKIK